MTIPYPYFQRAPAEMTDAELIEEAVQVAQFRKNDWRPTSKWHWSDRLRALLAEQKWRKES
jgi:hypothetical protein